MQWVGYGSEGVEALRDVVSKAKATHPVARATVIVPNNIAGIVARRRLAEGLTQGGPGVAAIRLLYRPQIDAYRRIIDDHSGGWVSGIDLMFVSTGLRASHH
ncbi:hypothetical protein [Phycicoccus sp. DTK01]|uniref:hypothetical protein n=1 Tax=Phycicoccus sp. DTK01 TaxID=2785745 RepID=UPI001A8DAB20|nr:hypothetical protein [Phycicoccus sp. DTK01]